MTYQNNQKNTQLKTWLLPGRKRIIFLLFVALVIFFLVAWIVFISGGSSLDERVFQFIDLHRTPGRTRLMRAISYLGNTEFLIPANLLLVIYFILRKDKWSGLTVAVVALSNVLIMSMLKRLFKRQRPTEPLIEGITNFSFPSGHAFMSVAFYGLLIWFAAITITNKRLQWALITFLLGIIIIIGFSRIYLRVHYATDIFAGFTLGFTWLIIALIAMNRKQPIPLFRK